MDLIGTTEVAARKNVDRSTVFRWVESGRLAVAMRMPGATGAMLFDPAAVDAFTPPAERVAS